MEFKPKCLLTFLLTPRSRALFEKPTGSQLVKKFPSFVEPRRFFSVLKSAHHLSLSWALSIQSILPHPTSWRSILILSSHLSLGHPSGLFPSRFATKTLYTTLLSPIHAICPAHRIILDLIIRTILSENYRSFSSRLASKFPRNEQKIFCMSQQWVWLSESIVSIVTTPAHFERIETKKLLCAGPLISESSCPINSKITVPFTHPAWHV